MEREGKEVEEMQEAKIAPERSKGTSSRGVSGPVNPSGICDSGSLEDCARVQTRNLIPCEASSKLFTPTRP